MSLKVTIRRTSPQAPENFDQLFARKSKALFGQGEALRLSARGENRILELNNAWREVCETAQIDDQVLLAGVGLTAFATITFSEASSFESVLIVPRRLVIISEDQGFEVLVAAEGSESEETTVLPGEFGSGSRSAERFKLGVEQAVAKISEHELEKVVLSRELVMLVPGKPDLRPALSRLRSRYPDCWTYQVDSVFGASPELLLRADRGEVSARVLAGTAGRGTDPDVDRAISSSLTHSHKNIHEHQFAVSSMLEELSPFCDWVEADSEPFSLALPDLWHLATDVRGKLKPGVTLLDVVAKLHPTAAVAGTPRDKAMALISEIEQHDRGGYAGPVGWLAQDGSGELAIALRGGVVEGSGDEYRVRALAGCGIVAESEPEAELAETELKFRAVRYAFEGESK
ncbi:chorismate-binding protein [Aquiluna borgnonia]|uniref:isochorismate synthase n=1 Tax=Aquiluna borgnonia TaxID=2499157 RepID=A0A7D4QH00_9MICO|nr:isochorismate synthase [Aquiluna borgnonia]QKJ25768.1 chorismate-binding protein [Aquiluna borgnonia]